MESDYVLEESRCDGGGGVWVAQCDEVAILGQSINHC
jgi:hypothetical protein